MGARQLNGEKSFMQRRMRAILIGAVVAGLTATAPVFGEPTAPSAAKAHPRAAAVPGTLIIAQAPPRPPGSVGRPGTTPPAAPAAPAARSGGPLDAKQKALVDRVSAYLTSINSLIGNFVQVGPDGSRVKGDFYLQKPGRVRFEYDPPSPIEMIADGSSVVVRDRKLATQDVYPLSQTPLRFLLADRIDLMRDTTVIGVNSDDVFVTVVIEERQTFGGSHKLMLMVGAQDFKLKQWTVTDPQGYDTTVAVYNLDSSRRPDPKLFKVDYTRYVQ